MDRFPHHELGQIGPLKIIEGCWAQHCQVSLGYPQHPPLLSLSLEKLLTSRLVADDETAEDDDHVLQEVLQEASEVLQMNPMKGYQFTLACMEGGYDPMRDGYHLVPWVVHQIQKAVRARHPQAVNPTGVATALRNLRLVSSNTAA